MVVSMTTFTWSMTQVKVFVDNKFCSIDDSSYRDNDESGRGWQRWYSKGGEWVTLTTNVSK